MTDLQSPATTGKRLLGRLSSISLRSGSTCKTQRPPRYKRNSSISASELLEEPDEFLSSLDDDLQTLKERSSSSTGTQTSSSLDGQVSFPDESVQGERSPCGTTGTRYRIVNPDNLSRSDSRSRSKTSFSCTIQAKKSNWSRRGSLAELDDQRRTRSSNSTETVPANDASLFSQHLPYPCTPSPMVFATERTRSMLIGPPPPQRPPPAPPSLVPADAASDHDVSSVAPTRMPYRPDPRSSLSLVTPNMRRASTVRVPVGSREQSVQTSWQSPDSFLTSKTDIEMSIPSPRRLPPLVPQMPTSLSSEQMSPCRPRQAHKWRRDDAHLPCKSHLRQGGFGEESEHLEPLMRAARPPPAIPLKRSATVTKTSSLGPSPGASYMATRRSTDLSYTGMEALVPRINTQVDSKSYDRLIRDLFKSEGLGALSIPSVSDTPRPGDTYHDHHKNPPSTASTSGKSGTERLKSHAHGLSRRRSSADDISLHSLEQAMYDAYPASSHNENNNDVADVLAQAGMPMLVQAVAVTYPLFISALVNAKDHVPRASTKDGRSLVAIAETHENIHSNHADALLQAKQRRDSGYHSARASPIVYADVTTAVGPQRIKLDDLSCETTLGRDHMPSRLAPLATVVETQEEKQIEIPELPSSGVPAVEPFNVSCLSPFDITAGSRDGILCSPKPISCTVCEEDLPPLAFSKDPLTSSCTHRNFTCLSCTQHWLSTQLDTSNYDRISCMQCPEILSYHDILRYGNTTMIKRYDRLATRDFLGAEMDFRWCRGPGCESGQLHEGGEAAPIFCCRECGFRYCVVHEDAHEGMTCGQFEARLSGEHRSAERSGGIGEQAGQMPGSWPSAENPSAEASDKTRRLPVSCGTVKASVKHNRRDLAWRTSPAELDAVSPVSVQERKDLATAKALQAAWEQEEAKRLQDLEAAHCRLVDARAAQLAEDETYAFHLQAQLNGEAGARAPEPRSPNFLSKLEGDPRSYVPPSTAADVALMAEMPEVVAAGPKLQSKANSSAQARYMAQEGRRAIAGHDAPRVVPTDSGSTADPELLRHKLAEAQERSDAAIALKLQQEYEAEAEREASAKQLALEAAEAQGKLEAPPRCRKSARSASAAAGTFRRSKAASA